MRRQLLLQDKRSNEGIECEPGMSSRVGRAVSVEKDSRRMGVPSLAGCPFPQVEARWGEGGECPDWAFFGFVSNCM